MSADALFGLGNAGALVGWAFLLASPFVPRLAQAVAAYLIPLILSVAYAGLVLAFWFSTDGGFDSLDGVAALFETREFLLAGWLHYLAFDLFVGAWAVRVARKEGITFLLVVPCLVLTFLFGPAGFLAFNAVRAARLRFASAVAI